MSAIGGKADIPRIGDLCLLMTQSGHWLLPVRVPISQNYAQDLSSKEEGD